ncbi:putative gustatory receptor 59b [Stomoxys calcitrans]|uniref:putative gustatory receptor 59b n=1 Tax=Stomoxys calcitrans TaxID=35570 RepID=UPI0027E329E4|nr:putative gustatory receptor 59b [Stomoxys calcitrans]
MVFSTTVKESLCKFGQQIISYYHIFMGLSSYWYCKKKNKYQRNMCSRLVLVVINVLGMVVVCIKLQNYLEEFRRDHAWNSLILLVYEINGRLRICLAAHTVLHVIRYDRLITSMKMELEQLKIHCLTRITLRPAIETRFTFLFCLKYFMLYYIHIVMLVASVREATNALCIWQIMGAIAFVNISGLWYFVLFQYFEIIWKICCLFYYIEQHVCYIAKEADATGAPLEDLVIQLYWSLRVHSKLCLYWLQLQHMFKGQIFLSRLVNVTSNCATILYAFISSDTIYQSLVILVMGSFTYLLLTLDLYINDYMCDMAVNSFKGLQLALKNFNGLQQTWTTLHQQCEEFSIYLCNRQVNLKLAGALNMDRKAWLSLMSTFATYSIVLIQAHLRSA